MPTKESFITLKANNDNGSSSDDFLVISSSESGLIPLIASTSVGEGIKSTTASNKGCTPLFLKAVPFKTGTKD